MNQLPPGLGSGDRKLRPDDEIYRSSRTYLGPSGFTLPIRVPYRAMPVFAIVFLPVLVLSRFIGVSGLPMWVATMVVSALLTYLVVRVSGPERPVSALVTIAWHEISAPRPRRKSQEPTDVTLRPALVPVEPLPGPRRSRRSAGLNGET